MLRKVLISLLCLGLPCAALAMPEPVDRERVAGPVPREHLDALEAGLPRGQRLVQTLIGDLDKDGKEEWIAIGEPSGAADGVSIAIFAPPEGGKAPTLRFAQILLGSGLKIAGAELREVKPVGNLVVLVGAAPSRAGDSRFRLDLYGWNGDHFRPLVPEEAEFRSQGGFSIEPGAAPYQGDELVVWTYVPDPDELLYDFHHYTYRRWRFDGIRFVVETLASETDHKVPNAEEARKAAGAKQPDRRRQIERIAEVP